VYTANTGMSRLLNALHMRPDALLGHSFGQLSALEMAGVLRPGNDEERIHSAYHGYLHLRDLSNQLDLPGGRLPAVGGADHPDQTIWRVSRIRSASWRTARTARALRSGPRMDEAIAEAGSGSRTVRFARPCRSADPSTRTLESSFPIAKAHYESGVHPQTIEVYSCATTGCFRRPGGGGGVAARHWMSCVRFSTIERCMSVAFDLRRRRSRGILCGFVSDI
jgi:hypothetical protein